MDFISKLDPYAALFGGAAMGALIAGAFALFNEMLRRRFEDRKHRRELAISAALKNWEVDCEFAWKKNAVNGAPISRAPLDVYLTHMLVLIDSLGGKNLSAESIGAKIRNAKAVSDAASEACVDPGR